MSDIGGLASAPPFPGSYRASGLLLHVTSLPSPYGTGDLGPCACAWIDHLHLPATCGTTRNARRAIVPKLLRR